MKIFIKNNKNKNSKKNNVWYLKHKSNWKNKEIWKIKIKNSNLYQLQILIKPLLILGIFIETKKRALKCNKKGKNNYSKNKYGSNKWEKRKNVIDNKKKKCNEKSDCIWKNPKKNCKNNHNYLRRRKANSFYKNSIIIRIYKRKKQSKINNKGLKFNLVNGSRLKNNRNKDKFLKQLVFANHNSHLTIIRKNKTYKMCKKMII